MYGVETEKRGPTEQIFHKIVEPSLGNLKLDFYPHHHSIRLHTAFYPSQSHCQLGSGSEESLLRPRTQPLSRQHGRLPKITRKHRAGQNIHLKQIPSLAGSVGSVSQTKELPLLTSRSQDKGSFLVAKNARKAMSVCSQYRYLGPSRVPKRGQKEEEEIQSEQVRRFKEEQKSLDHTRHLKRVSEFATYQHRVDRMYYMCGSKLSLNERYNVDDEELEQLRAFSLTRSQSRTSSGGRRSAYSRHGVSSGNYISGLDTQADPDLTIDLSSGSITKSTYLDCNLKEVAAIQEDEREEMSGITKEGDSESRTNELKAEQDGHNAKEGGDCGNSTLGGAARDGQESMEDVVYQSMKDSKGDLENLKEGKGYPSERGDSGKGVLTGTFVTQEESNEGEKSNNGDEDMGDLRHEQQEDGAEINDGEVTRGEGRGERKEGDLTSEIANQADGLINPDDCIDGDGAENVAVETNKNLEDDDTSMGEAGNDENGENDSEELPLTGRTEESVTDDEGPVTDEATKKNHQELGNGFVLDNTPFHATKKHIYNNTNFENPALKQFEDLATLSKGNPDTASTSSLLPAVETLGNEDQKSYISDTIDALISKMEDDLHSKDHLSDNLSRVGHLEDSLLDQELLGDLQEDVKRAGEENSVYGEVLNDEEMKQRDEMITRRKKEKAAAKERQQKKMKSSDEEKKSEKVLHRKLNLTDVYSFITSRQRMIFQKKFQELDIDGNGKVTLKELLQRMHKWVKKSEIKELMKVFDLNKDKTIDEREFVTVAALNDQLRGREIESEKAPLELNLNKLGLHIAAYKEIFEMTDQDNSGHLTIDEVMFVITVSVGEEIGTDQEVVDYIFQTLDINGNGSIDFIEFLSFIPFFMKLHREILGRPASFEDVVRANEAVKLAMSKKRERKSKRTF